MPRIKIDDTTGEVLPKAPRVTVKKSEKVVAVPVVEEKVPLVEKRDPRFPTEQTTDEDLKQKSGSPVMAAFSVFPKAVHFSGQHNDEDIIILIRAHIITNVPWLLGVFLLSLVPLVVGPLLFATGLFPSVSFGLGLAVTLLWYLGIFTYSFLNILSWYFNVGIVTNERVVDVDWNSLVHRDIATALMSQIQDVREVQSGPLSGIFDFGDVHVQTAGTEPNVEFYSVPHPQLIVRKIQELMQQEEKEWEHKPV
ncbi:hypothetical protein HY440_00045 [Candidatus Microgenomates bacterium]|nr:hypothetical protein [Candidatus Microgenomates bacterium]